MRELVDDQFYKILHKKYKELLLDFVLLQFDGTYLKEISHKEAVIEAISVFNSRLRVGNSLKHQKFYVEEDKMKCKKVPLKNYFWMIMMTELRLLRQQNTGKHQ